MTKKSGKPTSNNRMTAKSVPDNGRQHPKWKTDWPKDGDLAAWFRCGIEKCKEISDIELAADEAHCPIGALAELGFTKESLKFLNYFLKILPRTDEFTVSIFRLAERGASICLNANDLNGCEKYLSIAAKCDQLVKRKIDVGWASIAVREFRVERGLIPPEDAKPDEKLDASFNYSLRVVRDSIAKGDKKTARKMLVEMQGCIRSQKSDAWKKSRWLSQTIQLASNLGDRKLLKELIDSVPVSKRRDIGYSLFAKVGMKEEAVAVAVAELKTNLQELKTMNDPNVHFPVMKIEEALRFLIDIDEKTLAAEWFGKVARSASKWKCVIQGWVTTAVLTTFAPIVAVLEGEDAAKALVQQALQHATGETNRMFKKGAMSDAISATASLGALDDAVVAARKLRSPTQRRLELAKLFARAQKWKDLREICCEVASPEEAANLAWWVKFELPGGAVR